MHIEFGDTTTTTHGPGVKIILDHNDFKKAITAYLSNHPMIDKIEGGGVLYVNNSIVDRVALCVPPRGYVKTNEGFIYFGTGHKRRMSSPDIGEIQVWQTCPNCNGDKKFLREYVERIGWCRSVDCGTCNGRGVIHRITGNPPL